MFTLKKKHTSKILTILLLLTVAFKLGTHLKAHQADFTEFDPIAHQRAYLGSSYSQKGGAPISDYVVLGYAAWEYVHGQSPVLINPEMPPLGKYLMGISILLFKRIAVGSLVFGLGSLILVFLIGKRILASNWLALIPTSLLLFEPLFINQLTVALLETYHLFFILLSFYFFILAQKKKTFYPLAALALGGVMATKFYVTAGFILFSWGSYLILKRDFKSLVRLTIALPLAIVVLALAYFKIFLDGEGIRRFFGIQRWIWEFHASGKFLVPPGSVWQLIFLKKWVTWWADRRPLPAPDWQITWPVSILISLGLGFLSLIKKAKPKEETQIILIWVVVHLASLSFGITYPRYLLPILPFAFILLILSLKKLTSYGKIKLNGRKLNLKNIKQQGLSFNRIV